MMETEIKRKEIKISGLKKSYGKKEILKGISLCAGAGECVGILGSNGSGKSTLLSVLAGVQRAGAGSFLCDGEELLGNRKKSRTVTGYVPQGNPLVEELTAWDNLRLWYDKNTLKQELENGVLAVLGIGDFLKTPVNKMSGGMKKRLSIGCAVAGNPGVLLLDEPSAALDLVCREKIYTYLKNFKVQGGIILLATHEVQELELCDACYILKDGILNSYDYDGDAHRLARCL